MAANYNRRRYASYERRSHGDYYVDGNVVRKYDVVREIEKKPAKRARLASNIALANESLDDVTNAKEWINTAFEILSEDSKSELNAQITQYRTELILRENNIPKLHEQLGIEDIIEEE